MKTLTEFFGKNLRSIEEQMTKLTEESFTSASTALAAEGKSAEELAAALPEAAKAALNAKLGELTKLEGEKLGWFLNALNLVKGNRGNLKRVIVMQANEGEKAPSDAKEIDGKHYTIEFFAEAVSRVIAEDFSPVRRVVVGLRSRHEVDDWLSAEPRITEA